MTAVRDSTATRSSPAAKHDRVDTAWLVPILVTVLSFCVTLGVWLHLRNNEEQEQINNRSSEIALLTVELRDRLRSHAGFLRSVRAFFETSPDLTPRQWSSYSRRLDAERYTPGIATYGFAAQVKAANAASFSETVRRRYQLPGFSTNPAPGLAESFVVLNIAPESEFTRRTIGFDVYAEKKRQSAIDRARDTDDVVLTGRIALTEGDHDPAGRTLRTPQSHPAFLMMLPVYKDGASPINVAERRREISGVVYAEFRMNDFMESLNYVRDGKLALRIFDDENFNTNREGQRLTLLFDTIGSADNAQEQREEREIEFGQCRWLIQFHPRTKLPFIRESFVLLSGGLTISLLLGILTWVQANRRRQAERYALAMNAELIHTEARFKLSAEGSSSGLWDRDLDNEKVYISKRLERLLGFNPGTFPPTVTFFMSRVHPDDLANVKAAGLKHVKEGAPYDLECRLLKGDNTWGWFRSSGQSIRNETGRAVRMAGSITDISQRKEAESQLERYKNFLSTVLKSIPIPVFVKDAKRRFILVNTAMCEFVKADEQEILGRRQFDRVPLPAETAKTIRKLDKLVFTTGKMQIGEYDLPIRGRGLRQVIARKTLAVDPDGAPIQIGTLTDVTERRQAEDIIQKTSRQLQSILDAATEVAIIATDSTGQIRTFNRGAEKMLGYAASELVGKHSPAIFHREEEVLGRGKELSDQFGRPIAGFEVFAALSKNGCAERREWTYIRKDGSQFIVSLVVTAVFDEAGALTGFLGIAIDVSDRREAEAALVRHRDRLQEMILEQTTDLVQARDNAESASQAKSEFLANMSHEMRTPMHAILSFAGLGEEKAAAVQAEKLQQYFQRIRQSGERLLRLLNNLLDMSKLEAGKMSVELRRHDVLPIILEAGAEFESLLSSRRLTLSIKPADCATEAMCDPDRFGEVIRNLFSNAVKFSTEGGRIDVSFEHGTLEIGRRTEEKTVVRVLRITVADEGIGIPEIEREAIFEKFFQSSSTNNGAGGTGLGLAICREIMQAHRGTIEACNNHQQGASFIVQLPMAPVVFTTSTLRETS